MLSGLNGRRRGIEGQGFVTFVHNPLTKRSGFQPCDSPEKKGLGGSRIASAREKGPISIRPIRPARLSEIRPVRSGELEPVMTNLPVRDRSASTATLNAWKSGGKVCASSMATRSGCRRKNRSGSRAMASKSDCRSRSKCNHPLPNCPSKVVFPHCRGPIRPTQGKNPRYSRRSLVV